VGGPALSLQYHIQKSYVITYDKNIASLPYKCTKETSKIPFTLPQCLAAF
jgi:hypothetical protein